MGLKRFLKYIEENPEEYMRLITDEWNKKVDPTEGKR
jgi:hypothetical protein